MKCFCIVLYCVGTSLLECLHILVNVASLFWVCSGFLWSLSWDEWVWDRSRSIYDQRDKTWSNKHFGRHIFRTAYGNFTKFTRLVQLQIEMNRLHCEVRRSKIKISARTNTFFPKLTDWQFAIEQHLVRYCDLLLRLLLIQRQQQHLTRCTNWTINDCSCHLIGQCFKAWLAGRNDTD